MVVYAKAPFAGPEAVLAYLSRYTHGVAIANRRLITFDETGVTFRYKDYRRSGPERQQVTSLATDEFMRRFLLHVLPRGFHRIRHYGLLASAARKANIARARELLAVPPPPIRSKPSSRPITGHPVPAAAAACGSSRPSNAGCSHARRPTPPRQPRHRRSSIMVRTTTDRPQPGVRPATAAIRAARCGPRCDRS